MPKEIQRELVKEKTIELIHKFKILKDLTLVELKTLIHKAETGYKSKITKLMEYETGETIIAEGEFDSWIYWVLKGRYSVVKEGIKIAEFETPGEVFGEMSSLDVQMRTASVIAESIGVCFCMDLSILDNLGDDTIRLKVREGIQRLKAERLGATTKRFVAEMQLMMEQQKKIEKQKELLRQKENELLEKEEDLKKRERELKRKERMLDML